MSTKDERRERQERFARLDAVERRAIVKAVNRGNPVENRKHAPLAVHIAQRQMRFWKWSWLIGPAVGLVQINQLGLIAAVINALMASAFLGAMSAFFYLRARRAEEANLALSDRKRSAPRRDDSRGGDRAAAKGKDTNTAADKDAKTERTPRRWWGGRDQRPQTTTGHQPSGHLPGETPRRRPPAQDPAPGSASGDGDPDTSGPTGDRRPYQPRGKKRRRR